LDPDKIQRVPVQIDFVAVLIIEDGAAADQAGMLVSIRKAILASFSRIPYIASVEAIRVREVEPAIQTRRTQ
jgi:hypothetical protein